MQSIIYKATTLSIALIAALNAAKTPYSQEYNSVKNIPVFAHDTISGIANPVSIASSVSDTTQDVVDSTNDVYTVNLPQDNKPTTLVIVVEKDKKEDKEVTVAQTAKDLAVSVALIAAVTYATEKMIDSSFPDKGWRRTTAENIQKAIIAGIGLHWINECAKTNFSKVRNWFSAAADRAIDFVQDAAESAKQQTSSAKNVVVNAFRVNR